MRSSRISTQATLSRVLTSSHHFLQGLSRPTPHGPESNFEFLLSEATVLSLHWVEPFAISLLSSKGAQ
jgi:hypothetical protein